MGKKKNLHFEILNVKPESTDPAAIQKVICDQVPLSNVIQHSTVNSSAFLDAILENVNSPQGKWPREAFRNVLQGKGRMPRRG